ncbi:MAG: sensor histidine kinase [Spirochaetaceae bacterium]
MSARVLLVDDEAVMAEDLCVRLLGEGYAAEFVVSGEECMERLDVDPTYDVVVMDLELGPGHMTGVEATEHVRARHDLPVVFYTGHTDAETVAPTRGADAYGCVLKAEGDLQVLVSAIEQAKRRWQSEHSISRQYHAVLSVIHGLDLFVYIFDRAERSVLFVNEAAREHLGDRAHAFCGEVAGTGETAGCEYCAAAGDERVRRTLTQTIIDDERLFYHGDTDRWYAVTSSPVVWGEHEDACLVVSLDVTEVIEDRRRITNELEHTRLRLEEVNHRIKNHLTLVQSLVHFSESELPEGYDLADLYHQIRAIRVMYERLQGSEDTHTVDLQSFMSDILGGVFHPGERAGVTVEVDVPPRSMRPKSATPLGLIVSELALNAVKHAFSPARENHFRVTGREDEDDRQLLLEVADNAAALPEDVDLHTTGTTGLRLVTSLVRQLGGSIEVHRGEETTFEIRLPLLHFSD